MDNPGLLLEALQHALDSAIGKSKNPKKHDSGKGVVNSQRARLWMRELTKEFIQLYPREKDYRVFSKSNPGNQSDFSINELLYDLCVIKAGTVPSAKGNKRLPYATEVIWQVESEFQTNDSRETLKDFNKLILGSAENKLFIAPPGGTLETWILNKLYVPAAHCSGHVFLALVPHPRVWKPDDLWVQLFKLQKERWVAIAGTNG